MSLLRRALLTNFNCKRVSTCHYVWNEYGISCAQFHTLNNKFKTRFRDFKCDKPPLREIAALSHIKFTYLNLTVKLGNLFDKLETFYSGNKLTRIGFLWYKSLEELRYEEFLTLLSMPDTFFSKFKVIELHVWMLLCVLPQGSKKNRVIRYSIIMAMWKDQETRAEMVSQFNKNFKRNMKNLYNHFMMSLLLYDFGYLKDDIWLASAVWYNIFSCENVDPRHLEALVKYIRHQMHHLSSLNIEKLQEQEEKNGIWLPLQPHMDEIFNKS